MKVLILVALCVLISLQHVCNKEQPGNEPIGKGRGIFPGRVVWGFDPKITTWDGDVHKSYFWEPENTDFNGVQNLMTKVLQNLTNTVNLHEAWDSLFKHFNYEKSGIMKGYQTGEKIVIKINLNGMWKDDGNANQLTPQFLVSLLNQLIRQAYVNEEDISIYDASRVFPNQFWDAPTGISKLYPKVKLIDNTGIKNWTQKVQHDENTVFQFSADEVPKRFETQLPKCVTEANYMIEVSNLRAHVLAGITLSGKNHFGSIYREAAQMSCDVEPILPKPNYWCPMSVHDFVDVGNRAMGTYNVLPDLLGHEKLGGGTMLFFFSGMYGGFVQDPEPPVRFESTPFNNHWSSSILVSQDPMAIDSVGYDILRNEPNTPYASTKDWCVDNYLHEGALADNPPSKTVYNPTGKKSLTSLGVHEHWNNNNDKLYSRNLGKNEGIELVKVWNL